MQFILTRETADYLLNLHISVHGTMPAPLKLSKQRYIKWIILLSFIILGV